MVKEKIINETDEERFKRLAVARANRVLDDLRLLGNCSNRRLYRYSDSDVNKIFNIIDKEAKKIKLMFEKKKRRKIEL